MKTVVATMATAATATEMAKATIAIGKGSVVVEGCSVVTGVMVSVKPTIYIGKKKYRIIV